MPYDYLIQIIIERGAKAVNLPWDCCIVNTDPKTSGGNHWNLAMWRLHRNRLQITLWEPYSHNKYSAHIREQLEATFPTATINAFKTGVQKRGDGWRCGYFTVWWKIMVVKLMAEGSAPRGWEVPTPPPELWVSLVWKVLRARDLLSAMNVEDPIAADDMRKILAPHWRKSVSSGSLTSEHLGQIQTRIDSYIDELKVCPPQLEHIDTLSYALIHSAGVAIRPKRQEQTYLKGAFGMHARVLM